LEDSRLGKRTLIESFSGQKKQEENKIINKKENVERKEMSRQLRREEKGKQSQETKKVEEEGWGGNRKQCGESCLPW